jgi:hypothetical protein
MATMAQIDAFRTNTAALVTLAQRDLSAFWSSLDTTDVEFANMMLAEFYPDLVQTYGSTAALLAADFYDELRDVPPSASRFSAVMAEPVAVGQATSVAGWAVGPLFGANPDSLGALALISDATQRLIMQPARNTVVNSTFRDPVRTGFARVPSGTTTCAFCLMTASRGAVYSSKQAAGYGMNKFHTKCDCAVVPMRSEADVPEGYDPDALYEQYASVHQPGMTAKETAAALRSEYGLK